MSDSIRTEQLRAETAKLQLQQKQDRDVKELREKNRAELERVMEHHATVKGDLDKAYEVALSVNQDEHEKKLTEVRAGNSKMIEDEKQRGEEEADKVRTRYQEQISRYRANAEKQLTDLRREFESNKENIRRSHERGKA